MIGWPGSAAERRTRPLIKLLAAALVIGLASSTLAACSSSTPSATSTSGTVAPKSAASDDAIVQIVQIVQNTITSEHLRAVISR